MKSANIANPKEVTSQQVRSCDDLTGMQFGKWTALNSFKDVRKSFGPRTQLVRMWLCRCECGREKLVRTNNLIKGLTKRCLHCARRKYPECSRKMLAAWLRLKNSSQLPKEWQDIKVFLMNVGEPPSKDVQLTRRDLAKPHSKENTLWASHAEIRQMRRKKSETPIVFDEALRKVRDAKTRKERRFCIFEARIAGHTYEVIGKAAGRTKQCVHNILTRVRKRP